MRAAGHIVSVAVIVAVGVNNDGRREVLGMDVGPSEAETFWTALRLTQAGAPRPAGRQARDLGRARGLDPTEDRRSYTTHRDTTRRRDGRGLDSQGDQPIRARRASSPLPCPTSRCVGQAEAWFPRLLGVGTTESPVRSTGL